MSEWWINLQGDDFDLSQLATILTSSNFRIQRSEGGYYLTADSLNQLENAHEVWETANTRLQSFNGMVRLMFPGSKPLSVGNIQRIEADGRTHHYLLTESGAYALQGSVVAVVQTGEGGVTQPAQRNPMPEWVNLTQADPTVARVLAMFGKVVQPWKDLYPIFEIIRKDVGGEEKLVSMRGISMPDIKRFRHTANSAEAVEGTRHGVPTGTPPKYPMTPAEAMEFIRSLTVQWITSKQS
jgi:hypothetical protein